MHSYPSNQKIHQTAVQLTDEGRQFALAVVLEADGSTPSGVGSKALIDVNGIIYGTIGGGQVEAETQLRAKEALESGRPIILEFNLRPATLSDTRPVCGGTMRVLIDPSVAKYRTAYASASSIPKGHRSGVLLTQVRGMEKRDVVVEFLDDQTISQRYRFPNGTTVQSILDRENPSLCISDPQHNEGRLEVLVEPIIPEPVLLLVGGGHVGQAVATQATLVGFKIVVIDDRRDFTRADLFPDGTTTRCGNIEREVAGFPIDRNTYIVIVTRGHKHDAEALAACIHKPAAYIGMIGSRRKVGMMRQAFVESERVSAIEFDRVCAPIGLDIGAATVPEIATSIVAQLIAVRRTRAAARIVDDVT